MSSAPIAIAYLARGIDAGLPALRCFLDSHAAHPPGTPHRLHLLAKGWDAAGRATLGDWAAAAGARVTDLPDDGFDWGAYARFAAQAEETQCLFLNSHSEVLQAGWAAKLREALAGRRVGAAGCSGSWASPMLSLPVSGRVIRELLRQGDRHAAREHWKFFWREAPKSWWRGARRTPLYPNVHLRSNAFLMETALFRRFMDRRGIPATKEEAHALEHGRAGLTRWLRWRGLGVRVATADGRSLAPRHWPTAQGYVTPGQPMLLIADNLTRGYAANTLELRRAQEVAVWGRYLTPLQEPPA